MPTDEVTPAISIVVPVHNEAPILRAFLDGLLAGAEPGEVDVVVVCNGCTDRSAEVAGAYGPPVRVVDIPTGSKVAALNAGDGVATAFPRIYLDADVTLGFDDVRKVADVLRTDAPVIAAPRLRVDLAGSDVLVKAYYAIWLRLPWATDDLVGSGFYGMSAAARARFGEFPPVIGDDMWVSSLFDPDERVVVADASFTVPAPRSVRELVDRRARIMQGNEEVKALLPPERRAPRHAGSLWPLVRRHPRLAPHMAVYVGLAAASELEARRRRRSGDRHWGGRHR